MPNHRTASSPNKPAVGCDKNLALREHDISQPLPRDLPQFQYIIHAAGIASPTYYRRFPLETMYTNVDGLRHLLEYARSRVGTSNPVRGFLFYSSSEIYGDPDAAQCVGGRRQPPRQRLPGRATVDRLEQAARRS